MEINITININTQTEKPKLSMKTLSENLNKWLQDDKKDFPKNENLN